MEENTQNEQVEQNTQCECAPKECECSSKCQEPENNSVEQNVETKEEAAVAETCEVKENVEKPYKPRKNHRNKSAAKSANKANASQTCGEIASGAEAQEKLSGAHLAGYKDGEGYKPRHKRNYEDSENAETCEECECQKRKGPAFEKPEFKPRAVEISLDNAQNGAKKDDSKKDVVSYSGAEEPSIGLLARIKKFFATLFKKDKKSNVKFRKNRKDWKNKKGDRRFNNSKGDFKKGDFKNRGGKKYHHRKGGFKKNNQNTNKEA